MKTKNNSRIKNTLLNQVTGFAGEAITYFLTFLTRSVFIYTLGKDYLGIGGLFTNILTMLSLAELGIHEAMNYRLYKPLKENDENRLHVLMSFYKEIYTIIGWIVFALGLATIPFLRFLIKDYSVFEQLHLNLAVVFVLYLLQSACSYWFFAYKSAIVKAAQKEYYINIATAAGQIITNIAEIAVLLVFKNYLIYISIIIAFNIVINYICAKVADKMFPFLKTKSTEKLELSEKRELLKDCYSITLFSLSSVVLKATDNLVLSAYIGLGIVGLYSNYLIFYNALKKVIKRLFRAAEASIGNLFADTDNKTKANIFFSLNFAMLLISGTFAGCLSLLSDEFIEIWIGQSFLIDRPFSLLIGIELLIIGMGHILEQMRNVMGLFQKLKYRPIIECTLNIIISIITVQYIGIYGVLLGTIISELLTVFTIDPYIICKHGFGNTKYTLYYYKVTFLYLLELSVSFAICYLFCKNVLVGYGWLSWFVHAAFCFILFVCILCFCNYRTKEFKLIYSKLQPKIRFRRA